MHNEDANRTISTFEPLPKQVTALYHEAGCIFPLVGIKTRPKSAIVFDRGKIFSCGAVSMSELLMAT
jgi:hypothetical protein